MTFSHLLPFRVVGDGGSISKGKICSLKARVSLIHLDSYIACAFKNNSTSITIIRIKF